ncbi:CWF19-like protein 2 isoform X1 [Salvelinus namaycush]|uniref:CWF19-like protein 2 n=2 Tax=Salvelinus namaycush TaxID=8040 RepID=A0A8U0QCB6_SALNM|nr:CWF19-like protein 2 isoform X1 [Salvelinus namaycush]
MATYGGSFESVNSIEDRKEYKRKAREEVIQKAKQQYEKEEKRKELKRQRGEDTWMLPEVDLRLQQLEQEVSGKKKKEKKAKKSKKSKKKEEKKRAEGGDGSSSEGSGDEWVEAQPQTEASGKAWKIPAKSEAKPTDNSPTPPENNQRDEWMTFDFLAMRTTSTAEKRAEKERLKDEEKQKARVIEQAGLHKLELNPFWKDGGSGLPPEEKASNVLTKAATVDDGGLGWLRKSYQRMREQAEREQRSLEVIVAERYGSLEKFQKRMDEAEIAVYGYKRGEGKGRGRGEDEGRDRVRWRRGQEDGVSAPAPARASMGFLKPGSDNEESDRKSSGPAWSKSSSRQRSASGKSEQDKERESGKTMSTPDQGHSSNRPAVTSSRSDSSSDSLSEEEEEVPILTDEEMNKLGARLVKAEIMGNTALMEKLKIQLESARKAKENRAAQQPGKSDRAPGQTEEDQEVLLFRTDQSGRAWPVNASSEPQEPRGGRRKKKAIETHRDGERMRYFQDDDSVGLHEMVRREKMSSAEDQNSLYARMAGKMMGKTDDDNYTLDDMFVSSVAQREGEGRDEERMRSRAIAEHRRLAVTMEKCRHCFSNPELQKHLLIAIGTKVYLSLPGGVSLTEGHCLITPLQHHCSATGLDEDVWTEIQVFRRALVQMFESQDQDCVFMETHMNPKRRQHMVLECIPLPRELGDMAPIYFKKAIMECDEEWAMNKKVVDLSSKDIRHAVPRGLPYFSVDFGLQGGFAHVIENEHKFPHYFGKEIVGGMLDVEPRIWRKSIRENFDDQRKKVLEFSQWWKPFDCNKTDS